MIVSVAFPGLVLVISWLFFPLELVLTFVLSRLGLWTPQVPYILTIGSLIFALGAAGVICRKIWPTRGPRHSVL